MSQSVAPKQETETIHLEKVEEWVEVIEPDVSHLITEDDTPVDNLISEKQQRLLTSSLYSSLSRDVPFLATANVGLFYGIDLPAIVPDVLLSLEVSIPEEWGEKKNRSYFVWKFGKPPDIVIEIVSNKAGNELGSKLRDYAHARVAYYAVFDPLQCLGEIALRVYELQGTTYQLLDTYWMEQVQLGLTLWQGKFEEKDFTWLRWCDDQGNLLLTGDEKVEQERQRANRLADLLRAQGINPDEV